MSPVLIDSNIFVYAFDPADPEKHEKALRLIEEVTGEGEAVATFWRVMNRRLSEAA